MKTNMLTACFVYLTGDISAQYIEKRFACKKEYPPQSHASNNPSQLHVPTLNKASGNSDWIDWDRTQDMLIYSVCIYTPYWVYAFRKFNEVWPRNTAVQVMKKVLASSMVNVPSLSIFFTFGVFFPPIKRLIVEKVSSSPVPNMHGENHERVSVADINVESLWRQTKAKIRADLLSTMAAGVLFWWPVNALNFKFTPPHLRPVVTSLFSVSWGCYLSLVQYKKQNVSSASGDNGRKYSALPNRLKEDIDSC